MLARWAADCAARVLPSFERARPGDDRSRKAIAAARAWARGDVTVGEARTAALAAHAAAREAEDPGAVAAARAAGHAAATAHVERHAAGAATYAVKAVATASVRRDRAWQSTRLPEDLRAIAFPERGTRKELRAPDAKRRRPK